MANDIARVELHAATYDDYETLHAAMEQRGYSRTIATDGGAVYQLPTGTYVMRNANISLQEAFNRAQAAAQATGRSSSIIVTDWTSARFNLTVG